jgi:hypothetical protein
VNVTRLLAGRVAPAAAVALVLVTAVAGCGDKEASYCAALTTDQKTFAAMQDDTSGLGLLKHRAMLHDLSDKAPDDLTDEWQTVLGAIDAFAKTLDETGVKAGDFVGGQAPPGLSEADRTKIATAASELASDDVVQAADGIEQQAKDVCKVQLGL